MKALCLVLLVASLVSATTLEIVVTEADLQEALESSIEDTRISSLDVDVQEGVILLTAVRDLPNQSVDLEIEIWLDPESDEHIWCVKTATANGNPFTSARIELWNLWFNNGMKNMAQTELGRADAITIEPDQITFTWD
ncbi:MAG: hypothetical protein JXA64_07385 [Candidatus Fermentibacteraceae bacterium]|nr:hypothetical protein [Candidatus Fermentibacteraceae bacterium]MBN2608923.1 hypothetical protein [Candidatus Fermentibacteraceae bacterium]